MIPTVHIAINSASSFGLTALRSIIIDGKESVVTAIIKDKIEPLYNRVSAIGIVPKMSAYIGTPISVANTTPKGLLLPRTVATHFTAIIFLNR